MNYGEATGSLLDRQTDGLLINQSEHDMLPTKGEVVQFSGLGKRAFPESQLHSLKPIEYPFVPPLTKQAYPFFLPLLSHQCTPFEDYLKSQIQSLHSTLAVKMKDQILENSLYKYFRQLMLSEQDTYLLLKGIC